MIDLSGLYHPSEDEDYLPFQKAGIAELAIRPQVLLANEMGLGKTIQCIGYLNLTKPHRILIVCPNNLRLNWLNEINKWMEPALRASYEIEYCFPALYLPGAPGNVIVIATYEGLTKWGRALASEQWDVLIVDEAHFVKNPSTKRAKALFELNNIPKRILLTGTPICNYPYEIFPLIHFLDKRQWPSAAAFQRRYCPYGNKYGYHLPELQDLLRNGEHLYEIQTRKIRKAVRVAGSGERTHVCKTCGPLADAATSENHVVETGHMVLVTRASEEIIMPGEEIEVTERVDSRGVGVMIRRLKKEVLTELPRKRRQIIELPAEGQLLELVEEENKLWQTHAEIMQSLEEALTGIRQDAGESEDTFHNMIESLKFTKRYFFDEIAIIRHKLAVAKVPYVCDHIEDLLENKDKLVCFVHHRDVGKAIFQRFADKAVLVDGGTPMEDREVAVQKFWKDDKCELFIGSLKVTGLGINLQVAANIVFAELDWVPGVITQAEDRCHRIGQEKSLLVQHLVAQNSMDSNMAKRIVAKQKSIQKALNRQESKT